MIDATHEVLEFINCIAKKVRVLELKVLGWGRAISDKSVFHLKLRYFGWRVFRKSVPSFPDTRALFQESK